MSGMADRNVYRAVLHVYHATASDYKDVVYVVADDFEAAMDATVPSAGYSRFEIKELSLVGKGVVAPKRRR